MSSSRVAFINLNNVSVPCIQGLEEEVGDESKPMPGNRFERDPSQHQQQSAYMTSKGHLDILLMVVFEFVAM